MNTNLNHRSEENKNDQSSEKENKDVNQQGLKTSMPHDKEPIGPFEHSGEAAGWTEVEETQTESGEEKQDKRT
ncbi:MAG: hypothetical protein M3Y85_08885 [Bacteroidota bacterium]|nr:hypothetical protein [Bacteroidota bacterium]